MLMPKLIIWVFKASDHYHNLPYSGFSTCLPAPLWNSQFSLGSGEEPELPGGCPKFPGKSCQRCLPVLGRGHLLFYLFLIYNLFKLDCLGNLPNLTIGIAPPFFPLSDTALASRVEEADVGAEGELLSSAKGREVIPEGLSH